MERMSFGRVLRMGKSILAIVLGVLLLPALLWWSLAPQKVVLADPALVYTVSKSDDTADGTCDADCSLREAIIAANANPGPDVINLPAGTYTLTLTDATNINGHEDYAALGDLDIWDDLTINGAGEATTIIDGNDAHRIFHVLSGIVTINDVTLQNGRSFDQGGAIRNAATLTVNRSTITGNVGSGAGGILNAEYDYSVATSDQPNGPTYNWIDISGTGSSTTAQSTSFDLGFDFVFYGETFNRLWIASRGFVSFDQYRLELMPAARYPIPETDGGVQRAIHAHYHNTVSPTYWEVQGSAPNRVAIVQWDRTSDYQILLYEGSNLIQVQYKDAYSQNDRGVVELTNPNSAVMRIGIVDGEKRRMGTSFAHNQQVITDTFAIAYTPLTTRGNLTLDDVTLTANQVSSRMDGAGMMNGGTATVRNSTISHQSWVGMGFPTPVELQLGSGGNGSGIANRGQLTVENSRIFENQAIRYGNGAGLSNQWGSVTISNSQIYSNSRSGDYGEGRGIDGSGGGLSNQDGTMIIVSSVISRNDILDESNSSGGGVFNLRGHLVISDTDIISNYVTVGNSGGAVQSIMGIVEIYNSRIEDNEVGPESSGGAIDAIKSRLIIDGSVIADNRNTSDAQDDINAMGGAIRVQQGQLDITNSQMMSNTNAGDSGGAIAHISGDRRPVGYTMIDSNFPAGPTYDWVDISGTGTALSLGDDDYYTATLPFSFYFYNVYSDTVYVSSNGFLTFDTAGQDTNNVGCQDDETDAPNLLIAGLGAVTDDLDPSLGGEIYVETLGTAPNRRFVVQYDNVKVVDGATTMEGGVTFQIILYESSIPEENIVRMQYKDLSAVRRIPNGPNFTVKLESGYLGDYDTHQATVYRNCSRERIFEDEVTVEFKPAGRLYAVGNTFTNNSAASYGQGIYTDGAFPLGYAQLLNNIFDAVTDAFSAKGLATKLEVTPTQFAPGETITYTLAFTNVSHVFFGMGGLLTDVTASGRLTNISVQGTLPLTATGAPSYTWQLPPLGPRESGVITITGETVGYADIVSSATITTSPWVWLPQGREAVTVTLAIPGCDGQHIISPSDDGSGLASLIANADTNDTICIFPDNGNDTITLASQIEITQSLTITGTGAENVAISGNDATRLFNIGSGLDVTIQGMALRNGSSAGDGGAIYNGGTLTVTDVSLYSNQGASGGAIYSTGELEMSGVTLAYNLASEIGGAVRSGDLTRLTNVTFYSNTAVLAGGAVYVDVDDTLTTLNVTMSDNAAPIGGGIYLHQVEAGAAAAASATLTNTLVVNSTGGDIAGPSATAASVRMGAASVSGSNNLTGTLAMGPLQDNGGATETMVPGAAAIDAGTNDGCPATDQRGVARPIGAACDIGALEAGNAALSALSLNSGAVVLSPSFISTTVSYTATVPNSVTDVSVSATPDDGGATVTSVTVSQNGGAPQTCGDPSVAAAGMSDVSSCPLAVGTNVITVTVTASDGQTVSTYTITITREEASISAVRLTESYAVSRVEEGVLSGVGAQACYWVTLDADPGSESVTVNVSPATDGQITVNKSSVQLTSANWDNLTGSDRSNFVCVRAVDDSVDDGGSQICYDGNSEMLGTGSLVTDKECGDHSTVITHTASIATSTPNVAADNALTVTRRGADGQWVEDATVPVLIQDNDTAGVMFHESFGATDLDEDGTPVSLACYWVTLSSQPTHEVTITPQSDGQVTVQPSTVVIDQLTWQGLGALSNRICVRPVQNSTVDGTADQYCADKKVDLYGAGAVDTQVCGSHLGAVAHSFSSSDANYNGAGVPVSGNGPDLGSNGAGIIDVLIRDDESAGLIFNPAAINALEGGVVQYTVRLSSRPTGNVSVTAQASSVTAAGVDATTLVFAPENWSVAQTVSVTLSDDNDVNGIRTGSISHNVSSSDPAYNGLAGVPVTLPLTITDDDSASAALSRGSVVVAEGGAGDTYAVRLTIQPTADVVVTVDGGGQVTADPSQLTFTPANWNVEQSVSITAVDDAVDEGTVANTAVRHTASSSDPAYNGAAIATVLAEVTDNDTAALAVGATAAASIAEGASTGYGVALATQPTGPVQVFVVTDGKTSANPAVLTFDASNWNVAQTVTMTGADDDVDNAANVRTSLVTHAAVSSDGAYNGVVDEELTVDVIDNDVAAIRFSESNVRVAKDGQTSYSVTLATRPLAPVVVELAPSDGVMVDAGCAAASEGVSQCLVFTPENWNVAQTLTLTALTDAPEHIDHLGLSADAGYNGLNGRLLVNGVDAPENSVFLPLVAR